jgi:hypothetical protein
MRFIRRHISYANVTATLALVLAMGGGAYAALAPVHDGVIHTCYAKTTGALRVVGARTKCAKHERSLAFNEQGPTGRTGRRGDIGPAGAAGKAGLPGKNGTNGATGATGASVTSAVLAAGNATCPDGGSSFTSVSGTSYACNGTAVAFASVDSSDVFSAVQNVTSDSTPSAGVYCFKLPSTPSVGVASVRGDAGVSGSAEVLIPAGSACSATGDTTAEVLTYNLAGALTALPFNVLFD